MIDPSCDPVLIERTCGGWLAVSPPHAFFRIGVTADTEAEAVDRFATAWRGWSDSFISGQNVEDRG